MSLSKTTISANDILRLLDSKHAGDVFVPQCKTGATSAGLLMLDAWAMKKSWSRPCVDGYEIKVSRSDFIRDDKWIGYLPYCNRFWFACPAKLIMPEELPQDVGLLWVSSTGGTLLTKRKAVHRDVAIPEGLWRYLVMCRSRICHSYGEEVNGGVGGLLRQAMSEDSENKTLGQRVAMILRARSEEVHERNRELERLLDEYKELQGTLKSNGIDPRNPTAVRYAANRLGLAAADEVPKSMARQLRDIAVSAERAAERIERMVQLAREERGKPAG